MRPATHSPAIAHDAAGYVLARGDRRKQMHISLVTDRRRLLVYIETKNIITQKKDIRNLNGYLNLNLTSCFL